MKSNKLYKLEALRGMASIIVFCWHFINGFSPEMLYLNNGIAGTPWFFLINGPASVMFFFTLSGFVLTYKYFLTEDLSLISKNVTKRYFRLVGPVALIIILHYLFFVLNLYYFKQAGNITGSNWLRSYTGASFSENFTPSIYDALSQAFLTVFFKGDTYYCTNLWTMKIELIGSLVAFMIAPIILISNRNQRIIIFILLAVLCNYLHLVYLCFICGAFIAFHFSKKKILLIPVWLKAIMVLVSFTFLGYLDPIGFYKFMDFNYLNAHIETLRIIFYLVASILLIYVFLAKGKFVEKFNGKIGKFLGSISLPLYLVQLLIFCSFSSWMIIYTTKKFDNNQISLLITFLSTVGVTLIATIIMKYFDEFWVQFVNSFFKVRRREIKHPETSE